jgi:uncharacterized protein (TIGR02145 family)
MKRLLFFLCLVLACTLIACGDDSSSGPKQEESSTLDSSSSSKKEQPSSSLENEKSSSSLEENGEADDNAEENLGNETDDPEQDKSPNKPKTNPPNYDPEKMLLTDNRDGEVYKVVQINNQTWMAQGLRYKPKEAMEGCEKLFVLEEDSLIVARYGRHYSWIDAMMLSCNDFKNVDYTKEFVSRNQHQGVCPDGWHIPSLKEWYKLLDSVDVIDILSPNWVIQGDQGTDLYGFNIERPQAYDIRATYITSDSNLENGTFVQFDDDYLCSAFSNFSADITYTRHYIRCLMD